MINYNKLYEDTIKTVSKHREYNEIYSIIYNWDYKANVETVKQYIKSLTKEPDKRTSKILETIYYFYGDSNIISVKEVSIGGRREMLHRFMYKLFLIINRDYR